jgi:hypothetical protein
MKNIFEVDSTEIKRILSLHEESTKKQYLNVLNEQEQRSFTTTQINCFTDERCVPAKTKFVNYKNRNDIAIAYGVILNKQESPVNVVYYCRQKSFDMQYAAGKMEGTNETLGNALREKVCNITSKSQQQKDKIPATPKIKALDNKKIKPAPEQSRLVNAKKQTNTQQFATQSNELTKQIQTSLGNTVPTGQITDTDLDQLIAQLK